MGNCNMTATELEQFCEVMKRYNVGELALGKIRIVRDPNGMNSEEIKAALARSGVREASDEEILMNPFAGLEEMQK